MENYIRNVILIVSPGTFEYEEVSGRKIIEYVIDAARKSKAVDGIVVVTDEAHKSCVEEEFCLPAVTGSVENGIDYVRENYGCRKIIIENALCPMASSGQYDSYFSMLDDYGRVITIAGEKAFSPSAWRFSEYGNETADTFECRDYPYSMELSSESDAEGFGAVYEEKVTAPQKEKTLGTVDYYLSADGFPGIRDWIAKCQDYMKTLEEKYRLKSYFLNSQTEGNLVYEARSEIYGDIIIKFTPSRKRFHKEWVYYYNAAPGIMAKMIEYDTERNILVLEKIKPGFQIKFDPENGALRTFFDLVSDNMITFESIGFDSEVPTVIGEFDDYRKFACDAPFEKDLRHALEKKAYRVWDAYFRDETWYYLHRDFHKRNILSYRNGSVIAIDPMGAAGPKVFEYVIAYIIELREYPDDLNEGLFETMTEYFGKYVPRDEIMAAMFFFFVFKMNDYCFQKQDGFRLAGWALKCIKKLYFDEPDDILSDDVMPKGLLKI